MFSRRLIAVITILGAGLLTMFTQYFEIRYSSSPSLRTEEVDPSPLPLVQPASSFSSIPGTAFVFLALGATAHQMICPGAIESLTRFGGWNGKVIMITDQVGCFDKNRIISDAGMDPDKFSLIVLEEDFGGGGFDPFHSAVGFSKNRLRSKSMKAKLFDIIDDPTIDVLAYVDCDIIFAREGCPKDFATVDKNMWKNHRIMLSRAGIDRQTGHLRNIHSGAILMHREYSKDVLENWYYQLEQKQSDLDRIAYLNAYVDYQKILDQQRGKTNVVYEVTDERGIEVKENDSPVEGIVSFSTGVTNCHKLGDFNLIPMSCTNSSTRYDNIMMPGDRAYYNTTSGELTHFDVFVKPDLDPLPCMVHVSKARCEKYGRDEIQRYVDRFQLRTYSGGYKYCPSSMVTPILYGWFPLSYLPMCPKAEYF